MFTLLKPSKEEIVLMLVSQIQEKTGYVLQRDLTKDKPYFRVKDNPDCVFTLDFYTDFVYVNEYWRSKLSGQLKSVYAERVSLKI